MTHPTAPLPDTMPGVRDYQIDIPFTHFADPSTDPGAAGTPGVLHARVPATDAHYARLIGRDLAEHIALRVDPASWRFDDDAVTAVDVDDVPSPAEVAAERDHWRRVAAALAAKFPMMITLTAQEYDAADPTDIQAVEVDDAITFIAPAALAARAARGDAEQPAEPQTPAPAGHGGRYDPDTRAVPLSLLPGYGGHHDPDIRTVPFSELVGYEPGQVEVFLDGSWLPVDGVTTDPAGTVQLILPTASGQVPAGSPTSKVQARPATVEGYGSDLLPSPEHPAGGVNREMLTAVGWMRIDSVTSATDIAGVHVKLSIGAANADGTVRADAPVLLRDPPPARWS